MKKIIAVIYASLLSFTQGINGQVPKKVVVEHFTNTVCSICASKNPGFYTNLNSQSGVIHLAVHPSSPYSSCILNQHNVAENDARTNYYGVYGSTPRIVIQGSVIPSSANYNLASLFTPFLSQTTPASISIKQYKYGNDSIRSRIVIKTEAIHSLGTLKLFVALAEDTIFYNSPNGETKHFDVFRKSLTGATGVTITLPATVGDSVVYTMVSATHPAWVFQRIYTFAILQDASTKAVIQSESISAKSNSLYTGIKSIAGLNKELQVYTYERELYIKQQLLPSNETITIYNITGEIILTKAIESTMEVLNLNSLKTGIYFYAITTSGKIKKTGKLCVY